MPSKYMIQPIHTPHRFAPLSPSGVIAWEEGCLKCAVCVKTRCIYGVYAERGLDSRQMIDSIDNLCMSCFSCVQNCPAELIHKSLNPEYAAMGDLYWSPDIISRLWYQAESGKIPVSGAGYTGPFSGPGFDAMWTDMSEIVRPTRDGIHGREYISTGVDLGRTPDRLDISVDGELCGQTPEVVHIPLPILMRVPPLGDLSARTLRGWLLAARHLGTRLALPLEMIPDTCTDLLKWTLPGLKPATTESASTPREAALIEIDAADATAGRLDQLQAQNPGQMVCVNLPLTIDAPAQALDLARRGVSVVHLAGSSEGHFQDDPQAFVKDGIRRVHQELVQARLRDNLTVLASGGIAMAEHVAKAVICGADAVFVDLPLLIALECRLCRRCTRELDCPVDVRSAEAPWVAHRVVNLMGAWHSQLLEVMGAMGIRDARRLRGETGRAMFFEELERQIFEPLGQVEEEFELE